MTDEDGHTIPPDGFHGDITVERKTLVLNLEDLKTRTITFPKLLLNVDKYSGVTMFAAEAIQKGGYVTEYCGKPLDKDAAKQIRDKLQTHFFGQGQGQVLDARITPQLQMGWYLCNHGLGGYIDDPFLESAAPVVNCKYVLVGMARNQPNCPEQGGGRGDATRPNYNEEGGAIESVSSPLTLHPIQ